MLTDRDRSLVHWIGRVGAARPSDLMLRYGLGRTVAYRRLKSLVDHGLVARHRLLHGDEGVLTATPAGLRFAGLGHLTPASISLASLTHTIACATITAHLDRQVVKGSVLTERQHRAAELNAGRPLGSAAVGHNNAGQPQLHKPDMVIVWDYPATQMDAVEVELSVKKRARVEEILRGYRRNRTIHKVHYYAPPNVAKVISRASQTTNTTDLVTIRALPDGMDLRSRR